MQQCPHTQIGGNVEMHLDDIMIESREAEQLMKM
jgi:hypothetical protein